MVKKKYSVSLDEKTHDSANEILKEKGLSFSGYIEMCLRQFIKQNTKGENENVWEEKE